MGSDDTQPTRRNILKAAGASSVALGSVVAGSRVTAADHRESECNPETALQGQVPLRQQLSGRSADGYCNGMRLVGQNTIEDRGANFQMAWYGDYAYVGNIGQARSDGSRPRIERPDDGDLWGVAVIDASDPTDPQLRGVLQSPACWNPWEAIEVNERRDLLLVSGTTQYLDVFDISDPGKPELQASLDLPIVSHGLRPSPDGRTAYVSDDGLVAIDLTDPAHPEVIDTWQEFSIHNIDVSEDGTRVYCASRGEGLVIVDVSDFQYRRFNPEFRVVSQLRYVDHSHTVRKVQIGGREYLLMQDEMDRDHSPAPREAFWAGCPWGHARIVDITNEEVPRQISEFKLDVNDPEKCEQTQKDVSTSPGLLPSLMFYSSHFCGYDDRNNASTAFFSWYASGLRVADIQDPANPTEIAYYNPPPNPNTKYQHYSPWSANDHLLDATTSYVRYRPETGNVWFTSVANGFQIVELTEDIPR